MSVLALTTGMARVERFDNTRWADQVLLPLASFINAGSPAVYLINSSSHTIAIRNAANTTTIVSLTAGQITALGLKSTKLETDWVVVEDARAYNGTLKDTVYVSRPFFPCDALAGSGGVDGGVHDFDSVKPSSDSTESTEDAGADLIQYSHGDDGSGFSDLPDPPPPPPPPSPTACGGIAAPASVIHMRWRYLGVIYTDQPLTLISDDYYQFTSMGTVIELTCTGPSGGDVGWQVSQFNPDGGYFIAEMDFPSGTPPLSNGGWNIFDTNISIETVETY